MSAPSKALASLFTINFFNNPLRYMLKCYSEKIFLKTALVLQRRPVNTSCKSENKKDAKGQLVRCKGSGEKKHFVSDIELGTSGLTRVVSPQQL